MGKLPAEFLRHIIDEYDLVLATVQGLTKQSLKTQYPDVEWKAISGTRNILAHVYWGVDLDIIWDVVQHDLPVLNKQARAILDDLLRIP